MKNRSVSTLLYAQMVDMGGLPVRQPFPSQKIEQLDPFLLLHHADIKVPVHTEPDHAGVGPHPHRGFSPVTFIFKGGVHHRDSRGNDNTIYTGGAQWMNAGMGIIHSERPPYNIHEIGGRQEIIQLWINTPASHKMDQPAYYPLSAEEAANAVTDDGKVSLPKDHNAFLYLLDGKVTIEGFGLTEALHVAVFKNDGEQITIDALEDTRTLLMSGKPLNEKVASHGPFVMNTQTEIMEAMRDYQVGKMGMLIEE